MEILAILDSLEDAQKVEVAQLLLAGIVDAAQRDQQPLLRLRMYEAQSFALPAARSCSSLSLSLVPSLPSSRSLSLYLSIPLYVSPLSLSPLYLVLLYTRTHHTNPLSFLTIIDSGPSLTAAA